MSWETIKKNMEEHNGRYRPEKSTAGNIASKEKMESDRNFWSNARNVFANTVKDTVVNEAKSFIKTGTFDKNNIWNRVQSVANNNLNRFLDTQKVIDSNKRNEIARNMEDYTNTKRMAMQNVSDYVQEKAKKEESNKKKNDRVLLFDNTNKSQKDIILNARNQKEEMEQQIAQENKDSNNTILEQVYKQKNNMQENKGLHSIDKKVNMYEKNLAIHEQNSKNKKDTQKNNIVWQDFEDIAGMGGFGTNTSTLENVSNFAKGIQDAVGLGKLVGLGASSGGKEVLNYTESTNENIFSNYRNLKERQFLTSPNVSMKDKTAYKMGEKIETNLVKKAIRDSISKDEQNVQEIQSNLNYKVSQRLGEIAPSMGQMLPGMALSTVNPMLGTSYFTTSAGGGYINDALNRGMTEEQAWRYGTIMGAIEGASDSFITGQQLNKISNAFGGQQISKKVLESYGFNIFENAVQESIIEPVQEITAGIIGDKADWSNMGERMMESGFNGALMGAITNGVTYGLEKSGVVYNKIKNNEQITIEEYREALQENINKFGKKVVENSIRQGAVETYQEINNITNLQQNGINNQINSQTQQITNQENKVAQNGNIEQIRIDSGNFAKQVDDVNNIKENNSLTVLSKTPTIYKNLGLNDLPMTITKNHTIWSMAEKSQSNSHLHGLSSDIIKQIPEALTKPLNVIESGSRADSIVAITELADSDGNLVVVPIRVNGKSNVNEIEIDSNVLTSIYGKDKNYDTWMQDNIEKGRLLYDIDEGVIKKYRDNPPRLQSSNDIIPNELLTKGINSNINNSIAQNNNSVKNTITNNYMQNSENNSVTNNLANNQQTLYNNTESEGGIDGQSQFTNKQEISKQFEQSRGQKQTKQGESIWENGYKQNEQRGVEGLFSEYRGRKKNDGGYERNLEGQQEIDYIRNPENNIKELNHKQKIIKNRYEKIGVPVNFYSLNSKNAGKYDNGALHINTYNMSDIEQSNVATHEYAHHLLRNDKNFQSEISTIADKIIKNETSGNSEAIRNYIMQRNENINVENLDVVQELALEEILADYMIDIDNGVDFGKYNQYEIDTELLNEYSNIVKKYLPENIKNMQTNTNNQLKRVETNTQSLGYKTDTEGKQRKHYKSVMESEQVGEIGKQSAKSLLENDTYKPLSNIETLATANENISRNGVDNIYIAFRNKMNSNERITLQDIATGERLIQIFSQGGDYEKVNGLIQDVAMIGTELGQNVQALSLIKRMSPEGQLMYLQKVVERTNIKENADLKVSDDMSRKILEAKNETELENVMTDIAVELGSQLPVSMRDKVKAWRYLSMLGNPKTHIKNLGANVAMNITQQTKNKVAGAMEDVVGIFNKDLERTKTLRPANKDQKSFAKQDAEYMKDKIDGGGKYDIKNMIQSYKKQFDNKVLNAIANFNSDMLELEDNIFLKKAYQQAFQNYISANKLSSSDMQNSSVLQKAREYASYQAQEATFHQFSELAKRLTEIENKGGIAGKTLEAITPFKKTPINIAKSGIEYSPIGLVKSLTYDIVQLNKKTKDYKTKLQKGFISEAEYKTGTSQLVTKTIDDMAKGLTGTSLALLGYALKDMGILKAGNDGEDDEFREKLGDQEYAIKIGDNTYTLDWVSPSAIPMFMGATVHDLIHSEGEENSNTLNSLMTSSAKALEPMTEMSMLQGLTSAISSYEQGSSNMLFDLGASAVSSYMGQFVPTALGQVAKTIDDKERDTSSTEKGLAKKVEQFKKQQMAKIPLVSKMLPVRKDVWGNEKTRDSNVLVRAYEVGLAPYNRKKVVEDYTEKELLKVFQNTGEKAVLPGIPNKDVTINKQKYRLTAGEYNKAKETFGKTSKSMLDSLVKTKEYKNLTDEQKAEAINNIYSYAKEKIKVDYAKNKKQKVETTSTYDILKELKNPSNQSEYLTYSSKIKGIEKDKEKKQILSDGNYSLTTKATIYKNTLGKQDKLYNNILSKDNVNINEYLKYKLQEFESDKEDDGTEQGKSIKGSKPKKVYEYVNNMNITKQQKLAILGTQYKLSYKDERMELFDYINNVSVDTNEDRLEIFKKYEKNFVIYKDGTMSLK